MTPGLPVRRIAPRLVAMLFVAIFAVLAAGYLLFLRPAYEPLFTGLRPADASGVVGQLEAQQVPHRLSAGGTTVLVPADQVDRARVLIAGSDLPTKGAVGFELFNKSDMGLTDFAQKINYQRALQGELERTIMMTDGVDRARVHLALPERSLFRADRAAPKAALEIAPSPGRTLDEAKVAGLQRLVAFAVPDLSPMDVVVLDGEGRVLTGTATAADILSPDAEQRQAVERYYRARVRAVLAETAPALRADVKVLAEGSGIPADPTQGAARDFRLRVILHTAAPIAADEAETLRAAIAPALALDPGRGDVIAFQVAPAAVVATSGVRTPVPAFASVEAPAGWGPWIAAAGVAALAGLAMVLLGRRKPRPAEAAEDGPSWRDTLLAAANGTIAPRAREALLASTPVATGAASPPRSRSLLDVLSRSRP